MSRAIITAHLENAARQDAAGNHDEAVNELARGTRAGDLRCIRALGLRLLMGDRAPLLPKEGLGFIEDVCRSGDGERSGRCRVPSRSGRAAVARRTPKPALR